MDRASLSSPQIAAWLEGLEPVWTMLTYESYCDVNFPDRKRAGVTLNDAVTTQALTASPLLENARILIACCAEHNGLQATAAGNLGRRAVGELVERLAWPNYDAEIALSWCTVVNEHDVHPLHFLRQLLGMMKLIRPRGGRFVATHTGQRLLRPESGAQLFHRLFRAIFDDVDLSWLYPHRLPVWPQQDWRLVCWGLSVAACRWESPKTLSRLCTVPVIGILESDWDVAPSLLEGRLLKPLTWLGLLEVKPNDDDAPPDKRSLYRTSALFREFFRFDVDIEAPATVVH